jgi:hypothetical protein
LKHSSVFYCVVSRLDSDTNTDCATTHPPRKRASINFGQNRLTGAVFLDVAKAFDALWVYGLLYKLRELNFPS